MTFIANAANFAADANGVLAMSAGKLRGAFRRLFATEWTERWMIVVNDHAVGTLSRDAEGVNLTWFEQFDNGLPEIAPRSNTPLAELHQEIARKLDIAPRRIVFLPIGE
ncbi:MAG: hypothetical protein QOF41_3309 [Methylobacteriaceae bacterium]|jgi:hypothetical protein|nr:hypothetical protein [Methylobacteriaceae bacterium]